MDAMDTGLDSKNEPEVLESSADKLLKKHDYSKEAAAMVQSAKASVESDVKSLNDTLTRVMELEKKTRLAMDVPSSVALGELVIELCRIANQWKTLNEYVVLLSKRRAQLQRVIKNSVLKAFSYVNDTPDADTRRALLETLRTVSAGKMFVEMERARMTRMLSQMEEERKDLARAGEILNEIQVETIGAMGVREKAEILLDQLRLCLVNQDYIRCEILTEKVSVKTLDQEEYQELKLVFHRLNIQFWTHEKNYLKVCQSYRAIFNTETVQKDETQWKLALGQAALFCVLAPWDNEVSDLIHRIKAEKQLPQVPAACELVRTFTTHELLDWGKCQANLGPDALGADLWEVLHKRVTQHNLRVLARCYTQLKTARVATLLNVDDAAAEKAIAEMVSEKALYAKIDRPAGVVSFSAPRKPDQVIQDWAEEIGGLLGLVESTCHLIEKELQLS